MAYENVQFNYNNFCIAPQTDTYASIDTTNVTAVLQVRNSSGSVQTSFDLSPTITQDISVSNLIYTGPRNVATYNDDLPFFTLEHVSSSACVIKRWKLNDTYNRLDLVKTLNFNSDSTYYFNCNTMSVEHYRTSFLYATATGTGYIRMKADYLGRVEPGDYLYLGNSSNSSYLNAMEQVEVTAVSGTYVYITTSGVTPPVNQYNASDPISFYKDLFLFSDTGISGVTDKGSIYRINNKTGAIISHHESAAYVGVTAAAYGIPYNNTIGFVKNSNVLFMDVDDNEIKKSFALLNVDSSGEPITVYDIEFTDSIIYRLQDKTLRRDDGGNVAQYDWASYNYQLDSITPYVDSITIWSEDGGIVGNQEHFYLKALVRDQYGSVLSGQTVTFDNVSGDVYGAFDDPTAQAVTTSSGIATMGYTTGWYDPNIADSCCETIKFSAVTNNSNVYTGSQYVWVNLNTWLKKKYIYYSYTKKIIQKLDSVTCDKELRQLEAFGSTLVLPSLSKFWFPGGHGDNPASNTPLIRQLHSFESELWVSSIDNVFESISPTNQIANKTNSSPISQNIISRHLSTGNSDTTEINQFNFLIEAKPTFWSEKNAVDTDIWVKLAPYGFNLDITTVVFKVREVSYAGDTGFIDYSTSSNLYIDTFDAGAGLLGLELTCIPHNNFHHNAVVYVYISVYDTATPPNKIELDYWFKIIPDFKGPYIENEFPGRSSIDVAVDVEVSFDIIDVGVGVNISTLEIYLNNRSQSYIYTQIINGYHITCDLHNDFYYGQEVEVVIVAKDASDNENALFDTYKFYCISSKAPWIDATSFNPDACEEGVYRHLGRVSFNVYDMGHGLDKDSIVLDVIGKERQTVLIPIIYRIM